MGNYEGYMTEEEFYAAEYQDMAEYWDAEEARKKETKINNRKNSNSIKDVLSSRFYDELNIKPMAGKMYKTKAQEDSKKVAVMVDEYGANPIYINTYSYESKKTETCDENGMHRLWLARENGKHSLDEQPAMSAYELVINQLESVVPMSKFYRGFNVGADKQYDGTIKELTKDERHDLIADKTIQFEITPEGKNLLDKYHYDFSVLGDCSSGFNTKAIYVPAKIYKFVLKVFGSQDKWAPEQWTKIDDKYDDNENVKVEFVADDGWTLLRLIQLITRFRNKKNLVEYKKYESLDVRNDMLKRFIHKVQEVNPDNDLYKMCLYYVSKPFDKEKRNVVDIRMFCTMFEDEINSKLDGFDFKAVMKEKRAKEIAELDAMIDSFSEEPEEEENFDSPF